MKACLIQLVILAITSLAKPMFISLVLIGGTRRILRTKAPGLAATPARDSTAVFEAAPITGDINPLVPAIVSSVGSTVNQDTGRRVGRSVAMKGAAGMGILGTLAVIGSQHNPGSKVPKVTSQSGLQIQTS